MNTAPVTAAPGRPGRDRLESLPSRPPAPHTHVHHVLRRLLEIAQDVVVIALMVMLLGIALLALVQLFHLAAAPSAPKVVLGQIVYVLILAELYRTLIFYLREHRVSVALIMETAIVTTVNELILIGHDGPPQTYLAIAALLVVLGGLLALDRWQAHLRNDVNHTSAH
jgi:uncharacterized membrane protein (DUF373 family)